MKINEQNNSDNEAKEILCNQRKLRILNIIYVRFFIVLLFAFFVLSLIIPLRPKYSESEKRELAKFPKFTISAFFSGKYFSGLNEWYSDTFPLRDTFTNLNARLTGLYGKTKVQIHGTVEKSDDIPEASGAASGEDSSDASSAESNSSEPPQSSETPSADTPSKPSEQPAQTTQTLGALLINGDTAYEYYNFVRSTADSYTAAINRAAQLLSDKAAVYDMIVPTSMGITAPEDVVKGINTSDQNKAINYMYSGMSGVKTVPIFDTMKAHKNDYIYFRTDHHWTALGAYYAYCDFIKLTGATPSPLDSFTLREFPGYLGSFYSSSGKLPSLAANPDTVYAYQPRETNTLEVHYENGTVGTADIISDMSASPQKYLTFIKGDRPFEIIANPEKSDGSACIIVKESFGNAFVPFLVSHYQNVYIVDYRYFSKIDARGLLQLCTDTGARNVLFLNNISATRNKSLVAAIDSFIR